MPTPCLNLEWATSTCVLFCPPLSAPCLHNSFSCYACFYRSQRWMVQRQVNPSLPMKRTGLSVIVSMLSPAGFPEKNTKRPRTLPILALMRPTHCSCQGTRSSSPRSAIPSIHASLLHKSIESNVQLRLLRVFAKSANLDSHSPSPVGFPASGHRGKLHLSVGESHCVTIGKCCPRRDATRLPLPNHPVGA